MTTPHDHSTKTFALDSLDARRFLAVEAPPVGTGPAFGQALIAALQNRGYTRILWLAARPVVARRADELPDGVTVANPERIGRGIDLAAHDVVVLGDLHPDQMRHLHPQMGAVDGPRFILVGTTAQPPAAGGAADVARLAAIVG